MEDIIAIIILISAVYLFVKWLIGTKSGNALDGGIRGVTPSMVETVHSAFPHIPVPNIVYHLSRTRSAQATSEEILERGMLPPPPPTFSIPASLIPTVASQPAPTSSSNNTNTKAANARTQSLIDRYNLSSRLPSHKGKEKAEGEPAHMDNKWEESKEKRELGLRERKEKMILEARKRMLEKQAKQQVTS
ncbi:hypothetical protein I311_05118 [Cryptococcus gattii NT-10]|nr:hypothetical protein I311_05118 [Cryptococcus gattii NT-10]